MYFADYTVDAPSVRLIWQRKGKWNQQFRPVIEPRVTDLQFVRTEMKLFRHAETNTVKCDIYP